MSDGKPLPTFAKEAGNEDHAGTIPDTDCSVLFGATAGAGKLGACGEWPSSSFSPRSPQSDAGIAQRRRIGAAGRSIDCWNRFVGWSKSFGLLRLVQLPPATATVAAIVLFDGWMYLWHRANHKIGFLWRFHRVHHSDPEMDATTATRFHTGEILISSALRLAVIPLLGITVGQLLAYEMLLLPVILFHHSNVQFPEKMDRWLRLLIVTPAIHRVHHSRLRDETDSNYSSVFSFWDRIAKTFRLRWDGQPVNFGLNEFGAKRWERLPSLLRMPFVSLKQQAEVTEKNREKIPAKLPKSSPPAGGA
ncbi:MAG TPA: sterol desaturase family protein [Blastocatellia bacterium]|nr:sterol desaturase family protein [Blastocatellia bacterium]